MLKFLLILLIILFAPLLLNRVKVPHLIGLIIAGALVGPNGFNLLPRDANIVVIGTTGLLFIMFQAGLEIDLTEFYKNKWKSLGFGFYTFMIPLIFGIIAGRYFLGFEWLTAVLFASLFSSHTLITYPLVSKLGIAKNPAVTITVGGTMITDIAALLILAACVGMAKGDVTTEFWIRLGASVLAFGAVVLWLFPIIGRWFFKTVDDKISQFIFVMVMIYFAALLAEIAGIEAIIGAFLCGLALNRLIPHTSVLMNRIDFVGNSLFIPFFLISVGMIIDFRAFFKNPETIKVALVMTVLALVGKYLASVATRKTFRLSRAEGGVIFGLSSASAAATLASVMVGYNIILGENENGEPIRLLNESVLNGSILLILVSCTISSFVTQKNAGKVALEMDEEDDSGEGEERIMIALNYPETIESLTELALQTKSPKNKDRLFALNIIVEDESAEVNESSDKNADKLLQQATQITTASDVAMTPLKRYDSDVIAGINNEIKKNKITDLIIGVEPNKGFSPTFVYNLYSGYLADEDTTVLVSHILQPIGTLAEIHIALPAGAELEAGFQQALSRIWNLGKNLGAKMNFYTTEKTIRILEKFQRRTALNAEFIILENWKELSKISGKIKANHCLILLMSRRGRAAYLPEMSAVPDFLNGNFREKNYVLIYPGVQS